MSDDAAWRRHISAGEPAAPVCYWTWLRSHEIFMQGAGESAVDLRKMVASKDAEIRRLLDMVDRAAPPFPQPPRAIAKGVCLILCPHDGTGCVPSFGRNYRCTKCNAELLPPEASAC